MSARRPVQVEATEADKNDALFFDAVMKGDMKQARWFLDRGADVRKPSGPHTPLRAAALAGHMHMVKWLVDDLHVSPTEDSRVLCIVALSAKPSEELFSYLVERGADPTHEDATLGTPLTLALQQGHEDFAMWMIGKYNLSCTAQGGSTERSTPLHKACAACSPKMVTYLCDTRGATVSLPVVDCQGYTPLMIAVKEKRPETVELLLTRYKADPNVCTETSALFIACEDGYLPTARALLQHGADPNVRHPKMEITPLHIAASNDHVYVVEELIRHRADLNAISGKGFTPLIMACSQGYVSVTQLLLNAGADVNIVSPTDGATALHHAVTGGFVPCTKTVLACGRCDLSIRDKGDMTAADCARAMRAATPTNKAFEILCNLFDTLELPDKAKCAACYKALTEAKRCGRCRNVWYCSAVCQKGHWPLHKSACVEAPPK